MKMKYIVYKLKDLEKYVGIEEINELEKISKKIEEGRKKDEKKENSYIVINTDEKYVEEVIGILKKNNSWG